MDAPINLPACQHDKNQVLDEASPTLSQSWEGKPSLGISWVTPPASQADRDLPAPILNLDAKRYINEIKQHDVDEAEATELFYALASLMLHFVDLGFGLESVSISCGQEEQNPRKNT